MMKYESRELGKFIVSVKKEKGLDLSLYRSSFLLRRVKVRMMYCGTDSIADYRKILANDRGEWDKFLNALSINVSGFFRDKEVFNFFSDHCLKKLIAEKANSGRRMVRVWSAGCSRGEEAYSLSILLQEALCGERDISPRVFATDIDINALAAAKAGIFKENALRNISAKLLDKYFSSYEGKWLAKDIIKRRIVFKQCNLFDEPPFGSLDVIFCRNVRIYFNSRQAQEVLNNLSRALKPGGYLVLGKVEAMPFCLRNVFVNIKGCYKIFQKQGTK